MAAALTFFTLPKALDGPDATAQRNAIQSWRSVVPGTEVLLCGDDPYTGAMAADLGVDRLPGLERTEYGAPLLSSAFALAEQAARHDILCYAGPDLIFLPDLAGVLQAVVRRKRRFLLVGRTLDLDLRGAEIGSGDGWDADLRTTAVRDGAVRGRNQIDYVVFTRGAIGPLPPFAADGPWWGNWLIWHAHRLRLPVIDVSGAALVVHQRHEHDTPGGDRRVPTWNLAAETNTALMHGTQHYSISDATHLVQGRRLVPSGGSLGFRVKQAIAAPPSPATLRRALSPGARRRRRVSELPASELGTWDSDSTVAAMQVVPAVEVERGSACRGKVLGAGVLTLAGEEPDSYLAPAADLLRIRGGMVETSGLVPFSPTGWFVGSAIRKDRHRIETQGYRCLPDGSLVLPSRPKRVIDRPALLLALPYNDNYFHWTIESLGQLLLVDRLLPRDALIAVRSGTSARFVRELLVEAIGSTESVFELPPEGHVVEFSELYVPPATVLSSARTFPPQRNIDFLVHPHAVHAVRALGPPRGAGGERLYVTRERRKPVNDAEVGATLDRHGFRRVVAETLSVRQQMELFANADVVVGAHGAGLTNIVFSTDATVIELQSNKLPPGVRSLYWNLAAICGLRWASLVGRAPEPWASNDFHVDCDLLEELLVPEPAAAGRR